MCGVNVHNLADDPDDAAIIDAVINLGRSLGIKVVAEGVETPAQHAFVIESGCDYGQGHLYGKPAAEVPAIIERMAERWSPIGKGVAQPDAGAGVASKKAA